MLFRSVDYLLYATEVIGNIWESYPTGKLLVALALVAGVVTVLFARRIWQWTGTAIGIGRGIAVACAQLLLCVALAYSVNSEMKAFSHKDPANELAGNGLYEFFAALRRNELSFDRYYATLPLDEALATVRNGFPAARWTAPRVQGVDRQVSGGAEKHLNVILVSIESLGAEFLGAYGDPRGLTPNLDRLARDSLWFSRVYATGNRTVRGLEALSLGLPPTPGQSILRRPKNENLFSLGRVFEQKGYSVLFEIGRAHV